MLLQKHQISCSDPGYIRQDPVYFQKKGIKPAAILQYKTSLNCTYTIYDLLYLGNCGVRFYSLCARAKNSDHDWIK